MVNNFKIYLTALLAFGFAFVVGACGGENAEKKSAQQAEKSQFKFGVLELPVLDGALCGAPFYVAKEKGFFAEEGIDARLIAADGETRKLGLSKGTYAVTNSDFQFFQAIENGVDIKTVSTNLGHATVAFTMDKYGHVTETMMRDSADKMQRFIESL